MCGMGFAAWSSKTQKTGTVMKTTRIQLVVLLGLAISFMCSEALAVQHGRHSRRQHRMQNGQNERSEAGQKETAAALQHRGRSSATTEEAEMLRFMREEEKLARDVYLALNEKWGAQIFANISRAESQHMAAVAKLLAKYNIADPIATDQRGVFTLPQLQQLYDSLVASGLKSPQDAVSVGLKIEEMDIADLRSAMTNTNHPDVQRVLQNLERASKNHLRAFARQLRRLGGTYVATSLDQQEFDAIANSTGETGRNRANANRGLANRGPMNSTSNRGHGNRRGGRGRQR